MTGYTWYRSYQAALLENDWTIILERVERAESEILERQRALSDFEGTDEAKATDNALRGLKVLRQDVTLWLERQNQGGSPRPRQRNISYDR